MSKTASCNEVRLVGRVATTPQVSVLPSGDEVVNVRLVVDRGSRERRPPHVDTIDCSAWTAGLRGKLVGLEPGTVVEVTGRLRRRFWRGAAGAVSRYEVELVTARRVPGSSGERRSTSR